MPSVNILQAVTDNCKKILDLCKRVEALEALEEPGAAFGATYKTIGQVFEYDIDFTGTVTALGSRTDAPLPVVTWTAGTGNNGGGNDYIVTFPAGTALVGAYLAVSGDIGTGTGSGGTNNAVITQNVTVTGNVVNFTLYVGDDGAAADDARRRNTRLMVTVDCQVVADIAGGEPALRCETIGNVTVARPADTPDVGWGNSAIQGTEAFSGDTTMTFEIAAASPSTPQMIGLTTDPLADDNYTSIDYAVYVYHADATQNLYVYENGTFRGLFGTWAVGDTIQIRRHTGTVEYLQNGTVFYTSTIASTGDLYADSSFYFAAGFWGTGSITLDNVEVCDA